MMKALLISSSPHREESSTFLLAKEVLRALEEDGVSCEEIHLHGCKVFFCKSCETCHVKILKCPLTDDVAMILRKMLDADGIILASPNYINNVTASMKTLLDRSSHFIHCKRLLEKYVAGVVTSGSGFADMVLEYIGYYGRTCGAQYSGGVSAVRAFGQDKKEEAFRLGKKMAADMRTKRSYPEQMKVIEESRKHFARVMKLRKNEWLEEYQYWVEKGWL
ncbi:MAG: flavodoxin family protein [Candidatus Krumholzibacteria bacterium]|nr:flavodoxin family protein [Candidatus Krumholzibacteria bacterium]